MASKSDRARQAARVAGRSRTVRRSKAHSIAKQQPERTIIDVIDEFDHGNRMTPARALIAPTKTLNAFADDVMAFWDAWSPSNSSDVLTIHSGAGIGGRLQSGEPAIQDLLAGLLYYPRSTFTDPLAELFDTNKPHLTSLPDGPSEKGPNTHWPSMNEYQVGIPNFWSNQRDWNSRRHDLSNLLETYEPVRQLISERILLPVPQWNIVRAQQHLIAGAMARDAADPAFYEAASDRNVSVNSFMMTMPGQLEVLGLSPTQLREVQMQAPSFYFNKLITIANAMGARYVPRYEGDYELLKLRLDQVFNRISSPIETHIIPQLTKLRIPGFTKLDAETLVKIRSDEQALHDFRVELESIFAAAIALPDDGLAPDRATEYIHRQLDQRVREVERLISKSTRMREALDVAPKDFILGIVAAGVPAVSAIAAGQPELATPGAVLSGASVAAAQGIYSILHSMFGRPDLEGSKLVISGLIEGEKNR